MKNFTTPLKTFALAGKATFTAQSVKTGARFTFKVRQPKEDGPHFVSVMTGPDNENSFTFIGTIFNGEKFVPGRRSSISADAPSVKAFNFVWTHAENLPNAVEIFHAGKCACCGRKLTTPESVKRGLGDKCAARLSI